MIQGCHFRAEKYTIPSHYIALTLSKLMMERTEEILLTALDHINININIERAQTTNQQTPLQQKSPIKWKKSQISGRPSSHKLQIDNKELQPSCKYTDV